MITKFFDQRRLRLQAIEAEKEFWSSTTLTDAIGKLKGGSNPFRALAETGKQAYEYHEVQQDGGFRAIGTSEWITSRCSDCRCPSSAGWQTGLPVLARSVGQRRRSSDCSVPSSAFTTRSSRSACPDRLDR